MGLLIIILTICWTVGSGVDNATSSVRSNYRAGCDRRHAAAIRRRQLAAQGGGPAPRSAGVGAKTTAGAATIAVSGFLITRGFIDGVRAGWPKGKERAHRWADTRKNKASKDTAAATARDDARPRGGATANSPSTASSLPPTATPRGEVSAKPSLPRRPKAKPSTVPAPRTPHETPAADGGGSTTDPATGGTAPVSINTVTGGEVHSYDQLLAELNSIAVEAHAELEDAQADAERARQDAQRIEAMVGSLAELELDRETLGKISELSDAANSRLEAANARAQAAETRASGAMATAQHVQAGHQALKEAHASAPEGGAKKEFYTTG